jgi:hypothetical protein
MNEKNNNGLYVLIILIIFLVLGGFGLTVFLATQNTQSISHVESQIKQTREQVDVLNTRLGVLQDDIDEQQDLEKSELAVDKKVANSNVICLDVPYFFDIQPDWNVYCSGDVFEVNGEVVFSVDDGLVDPFYTSIIILDDAAEASWDAIIRNDLATEGPQSALEVYYFENESNDTAREKFFNENGFTQESVRSFDLFESIPTTKVETYGLFENHYYFTQWDDDVLMFYGGNEDLIESVIGSVQPVK